MLLCSQCECKLNYKVLPFLMISFRLTLQSPFIENEDAEVRIRIETRKTDWSLLDKSGISGVGELAKRPFTHKS